MSAGSSPLARGLRGIVKIPLYGDRIIPARAGFTPERLSVSVRPRDHPRSRGVYRFMVNARDCCLGSSPLARGLHNIIKNKDTSGGIIPARAGFTPTCST